MSLCDPTKIGHLSVRCFSQAENTPAFCVSSVFQHIPFSPRRASFYLVACLSGDSLFTNAPNRTATSISPWFTPAGQAV